MKIKTNNVPRHVVYWHELTEKEQNEFTDDDPVFEDVAERLEDSIYFRYRGRVYSLSDFMRALPHGYFENAGWSGYLSETAFSGVVVKVQPITKWCPSGDSDSVIVGSFAD